MNDSEINLAIAEACGWTDFVDCHYECLPAGTPPNWSGMRYQALPNYCSDLNAMHEAEKALDGKHRLEYVNTLFEMFDTEERGWDSASTRLVFFPLICATARQRSEAFLKTLGKWNE